MRDRVNTIIDMLTDQRIRVFPPNSRASVEKKSYFHAFVGSEIDPNELSLVHNEELGNTEPGRKDLLRCDLTNTANEQLVSFIKRSIWHR